MKIGLISDTHGLLRPQALAMLAGCNHIVHGGDIGGAEVLMQLRQIAPVTAVRGNNDHGPWAQEIAETVLIELGGLRLFAIHDLGQMACDPVEQGIAVVVSGHSHQPLIEMRGGVLYVNPGSAGPRRFRLPVSIALLELALGQPAAQIIELTPGV